MGREGLVAWKSLESAIYAVEIEGRTKGVN